MALTAEQEAEIIARFEAGERPGEIVQGMGILKSDFMAFRKANKRDVAVAQKGKAARLARLNREKADLENTKIVIEEKIAAVEQVITNVEAEEE